MSPVFTSGTSGDDNSENGTETVVRVMTTQMTKSIEIVKKLVKAEIRRLDSDLKMVANSGSTVNHWSYFSPEDRRLLPLLIDDFHEKNKELFTFHKLEIA